MNPLPNVLSEQARAYSDALERLRDLASPDAEEEVYRLTRELRTAVTLVGCLSRLVEGVSTREILEAFGAPGDFGYETPIGDALARAYGVVK